MARRFLIAAFALLIPTSAAGAQTVNLSGDRGLGRVTVGNADLADETFRVEVEQHTEGANTGIMCDLGPQMPPLVAVE